MPTPKYKAGDRVTVVEGYSSSSYIGLSGTVVDPYWDNGSIETGVVVRVNLDTYPESNKSIYENNLSYEDPDMTKYPVTRKDLKSWYQILKSVDEDDPFDNTASDAADAIDALLNPPVKRTYTIELSGKSDVIDKVLGDLTASPEVIKDEIVVSVNKTAEVTLDAKKDA